MQATAIAPTHASRAEVGEMVATMGVELEHLSRALTDGIHEHLDELDDDLRVLTLLSVRSNLGMIVTMLREGSPPTAAVAPPEALGYAREYVRRGLEIGLLQRAYRIGQATLSRLLLERLRASSADGEQLIDAVGFFNDWLFAYIETLERQVSDVYMEEREQWVRGAAAMRAAEVRALLQGSRPDVAETSKRLAYALDRHHIAFLVFRGDGDEEPGGGQGRFGEMERRATQVAEALHGCGVLTVAQGRSLACWTSLHDAPSVEAALPQDGAADGLRVAVGTPGHGIDGFCASHHEALLARRAARLGALPGATWVPFADVALDALATDDVDAARRFVLRELGPLADDVEPMRRLSATLRVFLEEGSSYVRAARRLGVHENTVTYRVHRAEGLLGHRAAERQLELRVALRLARLVLPAPSG